MSYKKRFGWVSASEAFFWYDTDKDAKNCFNITWLKYFFRFYLSFENSECLDYVTEKVGNILWIGDMLPIVLGGTNYTRDTPPHSVISIYDYPSPRQLAEHLHHLDNNMEDYLEYFKWRVKYKVNNPMISLVKSYCKLCEIVHNETFPKSTIMKDFGAFWPPAKKICKQRMLKHHLGTISKTN